MIRIENKTGKIHDTKITDTETGNRIKGIYGVEIMPFDCDTQSLIRAKLILTRCEMDITSEYFIHEDPEKCEVRIKT